MCSYFYTVRLFIPGQVASKKNSKNIVYNQRTGRPVLISSKTYSVWHKASLWHLKGQRSVTEYPIKLTFSFYVVDNRKRDIDNMMTSCMDLLQDAGIIESDAWQFVGEVSGRVVEVSKTDPRVVIEIEQL